MNRIDRLFATLQTLRELPAPVTAAHLAREMQVTARTVYRDIEALRGLGAVIDGAAGFGYRLSEDASLPPLMFADDELEALVLGLREVGEVGDPALAKAADSALAKLQARLPARQSARLRHAVLTAKRFAKPPAPTVDAAQLRNACWQEREVRFSYRDKAGIRTRRQVRPLGIAVMEQAHCLIAYCLLRQGFRTFRLDRMRDLQVDGPSFRPARVGLLRAALAEFRRTAPPVPPAHR